MEQAVVSTNGFHRTTVVVAGSNPSGGTKNFPKFVSLMRFVFILAMLCRAVRLASLLTCAWSMPALTFDINANLLLLRWLCSLLWAERQQHLCCWFCLRFCGTVDAEQMLESQQMEKTMQLHHQRQYQQRMIRYYFFAETQPCRSITVGLLRQWRPPFAHRKVSKHQQIFQAAFALTILLFLREIPHWPYQGPNPSPLCHNLLEGIDMIPFTFFL